MGWSCFESDRTPSHPWESSAAPERIAAGINSSMNGKMRSRRPQWVCGIARPRRVSSKLVMILENVAAHKRI